MQVSSKKITDLFFKMLWIREVENMISNEYSNQEMRCPVHLSIGQEAIAVGVCANLKKNDQILSAHRSHAHYLAKGGSLDGMIGELYGKKIGCAHGKGGSMHLIDLDVGMIAAVPIVGSTLPIAAGASWANKLKGNNKITCVFFGEGATEEGVFQESLDFASLHNLKILFVCENNFFSVYSHLSKRQSKDRKITALSRSLGVKSEKNFGNDISTTYLKTKKAINYINQYNKPYLLEFETYRHLEHCGPNFDDNLNYRNKNEIDYWLKNCPIQLSTKYLINKKILSKKNIDIKKNSLIKIIKKSFLKAKKSPFPKKTDFMKDIYA